MVQYRNQRAQRYVELGQLREQRGQYDKAANNYKRALQLDPDIGPEIKSRASPEFVWRFTASCGSSYSFPDIILHITLDTEFGRRYVQTIADAAKAEGVAIKKYLKIDKRERPVPAAD